MLCFHSGNHQNWRDTSLPLHMPESFPTLFQWCRVTFNDLPPQLLSSSPTDGARGWTTRRSPGKPCLCQPSHQADAVQPTALPCGFFFITIYIFEPETGAVLNLLSQWSAHRCEILGYASQLLFLTSPQVFKLWVYTCVIIWVSDFTGNTAFADLLRCRALF